MTARAIGCAAFLVLFATTLLPAQEPEAPPLTPLPSGARARLSTTTLPGMLHGYVVRSDAKSVTFLVENGGEQTVSVSNLTRLDISVARKRQMLKGAIIGTVLGFGLGFAFDVDPQDCGYYSDNFCSRGEALAGATLVGAGMGALIGTFFHSDRWSPVDLGAWRRSSAPSVSTARLGPTVGFTVRF